MCGEGSIGRGVKKTDSAEFSDLLAQRVYFCFQSCIFVWPRGGAQQNTQQAGHVLLPLPGTPASSPGTTMKPILGRPFVLLGQRAGRKIFYQKQTPRARPSSSAIIWQRPPPISSRSRFAVAVLCRRRCERVSRSPGSVPGAVARQHEEAHHPGAAGPQGSAVGVVQALGQGVQRYEKYVARRDGKRGQLVRWLDVGRGVFARRSLVFFFAVPGREFGRLACCAHVCFLLYLVNLRWRSSLQMLSQYMDCCSCCFWYGLPIPRNTTTQKMAFLDTECQFVFFRRLPHPRRTRLDPWSGPRSFAP